MNLAPQYPSAGSIIARIKGATKPGMPAYVGLPHTHSVGIAPGYHGAAYLGSAYNPFNADGDPNSEGYHVPNLTLPGGCRCASNGRPPGLAGRPRSGPSGLRRIGDRERIRPVRAGGVLAGPGSSGAAGVRPEQGRPSAPRSLLAASMGAECTPGPPAGRGGRAVRDPDLRRLGLPLEPRQGHAPSPAHPRCHRRQPDRGPGSSRPARLDHGDRHGRIRPHAPDEQEGRARAPTRFRAATTGATS